MIKYLLDTNIWSMWAKEVPSVVNNVDKHADDGIAISVVTACEAFYGWAKEVRTCRRSMIVKVYTEMMHEIDFMRDATVVPFTGQSLAIYQKLSLRYSIPDKADLRIAAIAVEHDMILVTRNTKDFINIKELTIVDWA